VHVPMERSIDIDSLLDFQITEFLKIRELDDPCQQ
jgi:CMP-N-acetylneuraminic acid synthetase